MSAESWSWALLGPILDTLQASIQHMGIQDQATLSSAVFALFSSPFLASAQKLGPLLSIARAC